MKLSLISTSVFMTAVPLVLLGLRWIKHKRIMSGFRDDFMYKLIFIKPKNRTCITHVTTKQACSEECSYFYIQQVIDEISRAKSSLSVCMYHLTVRPICKALVEAKNRGVAVRMISDRVMNENNQDKIKYLLENGVPLKTQHPGKSLMHHKFVLIDGDEDDARLFTGSINYTVHAFCNNWDHLVWTNNASAIRRFNQEFNDLWDEFDFIER